MPCDIGYRSVAKAKVAAPAPQTFEARTKPPAVDADLLDKLGRQDPGFLDWLRELDPQDLLEQALSRALEAVSVPGRVELAIRGGQLAARATTRSEAERSAARRAIDAAARRWQLEVLRVVAELLDFDAALFDGPGGPVVEGEKAGPGGVHEYLRISFDRAGEAQLCFEHYRSAEALELDEDKLTALAQRLGVRVVVQGRRRGGQPIPEGAVHPHAGKKRGKS